VNAIASHFPPARAPAAREAASRAQRHSREELEAMASRFVVEGPDAGSARRHLPRAPFAAALALTVAGAMAWAWWPEGRLMPSADRPVARMKVASALPEDAQAIRQRLQAERERSRRAAQSGTAYLERMAAADAATLGPAMATQGQAVSP
jgi:hypothetical protein